MITTSTQLLMVIFVEPLDDLATLDCLSNVLDGTSIP